MYVESDTQIEQRLKAFTYHPPQSTQPGRYAQVRAVACELARLLNTLCPPSRELSLAQTKLEEAVMWGNASIARNEIAAPVATPGEQAITSNATG